MVSFLSLTVAAAVAVAALANTYYPPGASATVVKKKVYFTGKTLRKCTKAGDRISGAPGKPYVAYAPCCDYGHVGIPDAALSWGSFCLPPPKDYLTCYALGARCLGAAKKPYVPHLPCCEGYPKEKKGDWGEFCYKPKAAPEEKHYVYYPPKAEKKKEEKFGYKYVGDWGKTAPKKTFPGYKPAYKNFWKSAPKEVYYKPKNAWAKKKGMDKTVDPMESPEMDNFW